MQWFISQNKKEMKTSIPSTKWSYSFALKIIFYCTYGTNFKNKNPCLVPQKKANVHKPNSTFLQKKRKKEQEEGENFSGNKRKQRKEKWD